MKPYGAVYQLAWPLHKGDPPPGKPRVFAEFRMKRWQGQRTPAWMMIWAKRYTEYSLCWAPIMPPRRQMSQAGKASIRKKRLKARMEKKFPLFAEIFIQEEIEKDPEYFSAETNTRKRG